MLNWAYIAGFVDGEGYIGMPSNRAKRGMCVPQVSICQAGDEGLALLTKIQAFLAVHGIVSYLNRMKSSGNHLGKRPMRTLRITGRLGVGKLLVQLLPYLQIKKVVALDLYRFIRLYPSIKGFYAKDLQILRARAHEKGIPFPSRYISIERAIELVNSGSNL